MNLIYIVINIDFIFSSSYKYVYKIFNIIFNKLFYLLKLILISLISQYLKYKLYL